MADKIVVMHDGIVEQTGAPLDLYDNPANTFVATFIGSPAMNMLDGVVGPSGRDVVLPGGGAIESGPLRGTPGQPVKIGVRPDHLVLADDGIDCEVSVVEPTGADTVVLARSAAGAVNAVFRERHAFEPGQRIALRHMPGKVHVFDADKGTSLRDPAAPAGEGQFTP